MLRSPTFQQGHVIYKFFVIDLAIKTMLSHVHREPCSALSKKRLAIINFDFRARNMSLGVLYPWLS